MNYQDRVDQSWAQFFGVPIEKLQYCHTELVPFPPLKGTLKNLIWNLTNCTVIQCDPDLLPVFRRVLKEKNPMYSQQRTQTMNFDIGLDTPYYFGESLYWNTLNPQDLQDVPLPTKYRVEELDGKHDSAITTFKAQVSTNEWDMASVSVSHDVAMGVFDQDTLVSMASAYLFGLFLDIGLITLPSYRNQGIGKALLSHFSRMLLVKESLLLYRWVEENYVSNRVATSVGYYETASYVTLFFYKDYQQLIP